MKKAIVLVLMLLLTLALAACGANGTQDSDSFTVGEAPSGAEGAALAGQPASLYLEANSDAEIQTEEFLKTNTTKIVVSAEELEQSAEVALFLYAQENAAEPIAYATLSEGSQEATFTNLTSAVSYKVGGKLTGGTAPVTLTITD